MSLKRKAADITADAAKKVKQDKSITSFFSSPKAPASTNGSQPASSQTEPGSSQPVPAAATQTIPEAIPAKFDKEAWLAKLL